MDNERHQQIVDLFQATLKQEPHQRLDYLFKACPNDDSLRAEVEVLLKADNQPDSFFDRPIHLSSPDDIATLVKTRTLSQMPFNAPTDYGRFVAGTVLAQRYRVVSLVGRGGMGEVYRATDLKLGQQVALKFLPENLERTTGALQRLLGEVRIARQISHPNICRVHDVGEVTGQHFLSMEYVDGEDLASLLRRIGRLPSDKAIEIARKLCAGLAAAHGKGILHRDLKPSNIMIDGKGHVVIMDFGIAALAGQVSSEDVRAGTPAYMAPEQLTGKEVTIRSDIYSLGLVITKGCRP